MFFCVRDAIILSMGQNNDPKEFIYDHITGIRFDAYEFSLVHAEVLDNRTVEFTHKHPFYEIYYPLEGAIQIKVFDKTIVLEKHKLLFFSKNVEHCVLFEKGYDTPYFVFIWDMFPIIGKPGKGPDGVCEWEDIKQALDIIEKSKYLCSEIPYNGYEALGTIQDELKYKKLSWNSSIVFKMHEFLIKALRHTIITKTRDGELAGKLNLGIAVNKYLHAHFTEPITLEDVADHLNFSSRHLVRAYKEIFDTSIIRNLNLLRLGYAKRYLCYTDYSIEKIAELAGFGSSRTLYKLFKKYEGIAISQYRDKVSAGSAIIVDKPEKKDEKCIFLS